MGLFTLMTRQGLRSRGALTKFMRPYSTFRVALLKKGDHLNHVENLKKLNFFDNNSTQLKIATSVEFSMNEMENDTLIPISTDEYLEMKENLIEKLKTFPEGGIFCPGTGAIHTGELTEDGKKVGVNRGLIIATGSGEYIEWDKQTVSGIDFWPEDYSVRTGSKDVALLVKRLTETGRDHVITMKTCLDIKEDSKLGFDLVPDFIISPSFGSPLQDKEVEATYHGGVAILCDNSNSDLQTLLDNRKELLIDTSSETEINVKSGLWDVVQKDVGKYAWLRSFNVLGNMLSLPIFSFLPDLSSYKEIIDIYRKTTSFGEYYPELGIAITNEKEIKDISIEQIQARMLYPDFNIFYNKTNPDKLLEDCKDVAKTLPFEFLEKELKVFIDDFVNSKLSAEDILSKTPNEWSTLLNDGSFQENLLDHLNLKVYELLVSTGEEKVNQLSDVYKDKLSLFIQNSISINIFDNMVDQNSDSSYLTDSITSSVLSSQLQTTAERVSEIQKQLINNAAHLDTTKQEIAKRNNDLKELELEIASKVDADPLLVEKQLELSKEIADLKNKLEEFEKERNESEKEERKRTEDIKEKNERKEELEKKEKERKREVYKVK